MRFLTLTLASAGAAALVMSAAMMGSSGAAWSQSPGKNAGCPPGLAKKGCAPPGQAKKYAVGQPLPTDYGCLDDWGRYDLGRPRDGYCYSRVDNDIVLIARATRNVIELVKIIDILSH
ncbi:MAG: RcnB family protein [Hyphomonadaceae bacterium]|nr:RcnB family protein [Hyphomonadaceae bacterium]